MTGSSVTVTTVGPTPFTGMSNAAAQAMASALTRTQQPAAGIWNVNICFYDKVGIWITKGNSG